PDGVLTFSRWYSPGQTSEAARLLAVATASLLERHVQNPADHIALLAWAPEHPGFGDGGLTTALISPAPLSAADVAKLRARSTDLQFTVLAMPGMAPADPVLRSILATREIDRLGEAGVSSSLD